MHGDITFRRQEQHVGGLSYVPGTALQTATASLLLLSDRIIFTGTSCTAWRCNFSTKFPYDFEHLE
jgi:hypothetical protein